MENKTKNRTLTKFLIALIVVLLTAPPLFAKTNPGKKMKPDGIAKKTKQAKLTKEKINNILDRIEENRPERAKQLRKLRKNNPEKFRTKLRKIMQKWASKKDRKPEDSARRGKGKDKSFAHDEFKGSRRNRRWAQSERCPFAQADAPSCCPQFRGRQQRRQKMFHDDYRPGPQRGHGCRGQGLRGQGRRHQGMGFDHGRRGRGQGRHQGMGFDHGQGQSFRGHGRKGRGQGRHQGMGFDHGQGQSFRGHGRRGRGQGRHQGMGFDHGQGQGLRGQGCYQRMDFDHGQGHGFNRGHGYSRPEHDYNREPQRTGPYIDWDE